MSAADHPLPHFRPLCRLFHWQGFNSDGSEVEASPMGQFMWMGQWDDPCGEVGPIQSYKHVWTRRYIHLDAEGRFYVYRPNGPYYGGCPYVDAESAERVMYEVFDGASWQDWDEFATPNVEHLPDWPGCT